MSTVTKLKVPYVRPDGTQIAAVGELVEPEQTKEPWSEYRLADGTTLRAKLALMQVVRLDEEKMLNGDPVYICQFQQGFTIYKPI